MLCCCLGFLWQFATVHRNYQGNWTALFCIGQETPFPDLPGEDPYRFANSRGFDGQFYYLMAHDPRPAGALAAAIDSPDLRYQRILVPFLAYAGALGTAGNVAFCYVAVNLLFLFLGAWAVGRLAAFYGSNPAWAMAFLAIPAVPISLDRMTVDLALVSLAAAAMYFWTANQTRKLFVVMVLLGLTRDTGILIVAAFAGFFLLRKEWRRAAVAVIAAMPAIIWVTYVTALHPLQVRPWLPEHPFSFTWDFLVRPESYAFAPAINIIVRALDLAALAGSAAALVIDLREAWRTPATPAAAINVCFGALALYLFALDGWTHVYDFGRVLSPLVLTLLLSGVFSGRWLLFLPAGLMTLRVAAQMAPQLLGIL